MSTLPTFGINGFGRIGRTSLRVWWYYHRHRLDLKLINTSGSMEIEDWAHLIKYDSNYGQFHQSLSVQRFRSTKEVTDEQPELGTITIGDRVITVTSQRNPAKIPWGKNQVETIIESTGVFVTVDKAKLHLDGGAKTVIISAPAKGEGVSLGVIGVNKFDPNNPIRSNASCTTNCVAPVAEVMHRIFGVQKAMLNTIHSYTDDQNTHDNSHKDLRRARAAAQNIVPTTTGAAIAVTQVIPELQGLFDGLSVRVPTPVGSLSDMVFLLNRDVTKEEVNQALIDASNQGRYQGILAVTTDAIVSSDIIGRRESSIVDLSLTYVVGGNLVKVIAWYDNEFGYSCQVVRVMEDMAGVNPPAFPR